MKCRFGPGFWLLGAIWARIGGSLPIIGDKVPIRPRVLASGAIGARIAGRCRLSATKCRFGPWFWLLGAIWARIGGLLPIIGDKVPIRPLVLAFGGDLGPDRRAAADNRQ